jgi:hypothetical protein
MPWLPAPTGLSIGQWLKLAAAVYALNFALTFHNIWPTPWITTRHELSVEIAALLVALVVLVKAAGTVPKSARWLAALVLTALAVGRYAEVTAPALYGRRINLYWDAQHLPGVAAMLVEAAPWWLVVAFLAGIAAILTAVFFGLRWCLATVSEAIKSPRAARALGLVGGVLVVAYVLEYTPLPVKVWQWYSLPVTTTYWRQAEFVLAAADASRAAAELPAPVSLSAPDLARVDGADVLVVLVES